MPNGLKEITDDVEVDDCITISLFKGVISVPAKINTLTREKTLILG